MLSRFIKAVSLGLQLGKRNESGKPVDVKGKAVFVGLSERILAERKDSFYTVFSQANGVFIGGVEIAATAFLNMLEDRPVNPIGSQYYLLLIVLWGVLIGSICRTSSIIIGAASAVDLSVAYFVVAGLTCYRPSAKNGSSRLPSKLQNAQSERL